MSGWRPATRALTGTNDVPLVNKRRFGPVLIEDSAPPQLAQPSPSAYSRPPTGDTSGIKRGREDERPQGGGSSDAAADPNAPRKRKSRWGDAKAELPGLPTAVSSAGISGKELDNYAIQIRLEEVNRKLRLNDVVPPERERSPSPPPTYDAHGRRTNTRDVRYRRRLEEERVKLVERAIKADPNYKPPAEYHQQKRSHRPQDKVYIPVKEFPEINFFGLLVGPRGNSLKKMEKESGAKISIRGKGSVKEGKGRPDAFADDAEEDLHCLIMADTQEKVQACVDLINKVIETAASTPEGQNDHKRNQLRELAALNGTLRDDENQVCQNCGGVGHRKYDCPEQRNFTANIICRICGSAGHMARDCTTRRDPNGFMAPPPPGGFAPTPGRTGPTSGPGFDSEYASLMAELGEGGASGDGAPKTPWGRTDGGDHLAIGGGSKIPPWRLPESWINQGGGGGGPSSGGGYRPPQQGGPGVSSYGGAPGFGGYNAQPGYGATAGGYGDAAQYGAGAAQWGAQGYSQAQPNAQYGQQQQPTAVAQYYQNMQQQHST